MHKTFQPLTNGTDLPNFLLGHNGVTFLRSNSIKSSVYLGNKRGAIDIQGGAWADKRELQQHILQSRIDYENRKKVGDKKKPARVKTQAVTNSLINSTAQISENLSTTTDPLLTTFPELSTKKAPRLYKVNRKEIPKRVSAYVNTRAGKKNGLYMCTITFPPTVSDNMGYRILNFFFTRLRLKNKIQGYIWVAERQPVSGTIHYHILVPHYFDVIFWNDEMKDILRYYADKKEIPDNQLYRIPGRKGYNGVDMQGRRKDKFSKKVPTNFAKPKESKALAYYVTKYITKNQEGFTHLAWHNSREFTGFFTSIALTATQINRLGIRSYLAMHRVFHQNADDPAAGRFTFIPWGRGGPHPLFTKELFEVNSYFMETVYPSQLVKPKKSI